MGELEAVAEGDDVDESDENIIAVKENKILVQ
jgi:hypothetical protein